VVAQYSDTGSLIRVIDQGLDQASDVEIGPDNKIYVGDPAGGSGTIRRYATPTSVREDFSTGIRGYRIAFGPDQNNDGISDIYATTASNDDIRMVSGADGSSLGVFYSSASPRLLGTGIVWGPDVNSDSLDDLWVSSESGRMLVFNRDGTVINDNFVANFADEDDLFVGPDGKVYGTEYARNSVFRHDSTGSLEFVAQAQVPAGNKMWGFGLEIDPSDGKLLVGTRFDATNDFNGLVWSFSAPGYGDNPTPEFITEPSLAFDFGPQVTIRGITHYVAVPEPASLALGALGGLIALALGSRGRSS
jgi:hypothetical protein